MHLQIADLACGRGRQSVLTDVTFDVARGSRVAIVGPNGSGKSTLLRVLAGWDRPHRGRVLLDGRSMATLGDRDRARRLAVVSQNEVPPADMLVRDLVALGRLPFRSPWRTGDGDDRADDALRRLALGHLANRSVDRLSGGEVRRVLVARAIAQEAQLLILDEPTNHLDLRHQHELLTILCDLGVTVVAAIHDLDLAERYFDRIAVVTGGTLLRPQPSVEALTPEVLVDVFGVIGTRVLNPATGRSHLVVDPLVGKG